MIQWRAMCLSVRNREKKWTTLVNAAVSHIKDVMIAEALAMLVLKVFRTGPCSYCDVRDGLEAV